MGGESLVIHNGLDASYLAVARRLFERSATRKPEFDLGYFSGTASHNGDFASIGAVVARYLKERPSARMCVVGPVDLPEALAGLEDRITPPAVVLDNACVYVMICSVSGSGAGRHRGRGP